MDNLQRTLDILYLIPKHPNSIPTPELLKKLHAQGHSNLKLRTLQRDLEKISAAKIPISSSENTKPLQWFWTESSKRLQLPAMSTEEAIAFALVKTFLDKLLPPVVQDRIIDIFQLAEETLKKSDFASWIDKVRTVPSNLELISPKIDQAILNVIYDALLKNICIKATYNPLETEKLDDILIYPLAIVMRHNIGYLVATSDEHETPKQFALHRFQKAKIYEKNAKNSTNFSLEKYITAGAFEYPIKNAPVKIDLKLIIKDYMKLILTETPLSKNQVITAYQDNFYLLRATVKNTRQLRWWIHSFAPGIVILEPSELRKEFVDTLNELKNLYDKFPTA